MYKLFKSCLWLVWILDILNMPFIEVLDTTFPINTLAWILIFLFV